MALDKLVLDSYNHIASSNAFVIGMSFFIVGFFLISVFERIVRKKIRLKRHKSNLGTFIHVLRYSMSAILILYLILAYKRPETDYSVIIGLLSASLGFALQKPITSAAGWLIIIFKKPFYIGDRIIIGSVKGDVVDITLSHIVLQEIGGTVSSEDLSGRIVHIPNLILFEENIINYTFTDEYILDEVSVLITYESNLEKAEIIIQKSANKVLNALKDVYKKPPYIRLHFDESGVIIKVRYFVRASKRHEISSDIVRLIHDRFRREEDVNIAYPHMQLVPHDTFTVKNEVSDQKSSRTKRLKKKK